MNGTQSAANPLAIRALLFLASSLYAVALSTTAGRQWAQKQTWTTVVFGVALTLGFLRLEDEESADRAMWAFVASGTPIIVRSLVLQTLDMLSREDLEQKRFG